MRFFRSFLLALIALWTSLPVVVFSQRSDPTDWSFRPRSNTGSWSSTTPASPLGSRIPPRQKNDFRSRSSSTVTTTPFSRPPATSSDTPSLNAEHDEHVAATTKEVLDSFLTRESRNSFISRVYAILSVQLAVTAGSILCFGLNPSLSLWMIQPGSLGAVVPAIALFFSSISVLIMTFSEHARRTSPLKFQLLALFTAGEALSVGFLSSFYHFRSVLSAMFATAVATASISIYTIRQQNPKYDLSRWGAGLSSCGLIFLGLDLIQLLQVFGILPAGFMPISETLMALLGSCLFSFYLAYHTKLIVAGKHTKYQMNEKDYVFGAMTLYMDIINLFIYILRLIGDENNGHHRRR